MDEAVQEYLRLGAEKMGFALDREQIRQFTVYSELLVQWNEKMNLTAITDPADVIPCTFWTARPFCPPGPWGGRKLIDVGTGAGFPGLVLRILDPTIRLTLLDSLGKRVDFLQETAQAMDLKRIQCVHARAEEFARQHREKFDIATSRAVAQLNILCELALPLVKVGGQFLAMKSVDSDQEVQSAKSAIASWAEKLENLGLHHSRYGHSSPGGDHSKAASYSGGLSPSLCPNQKSAAGLNPICIRGTWIWEKS